MNQQDPYAELRAAHAAGKIIQANRGTKEEPNWVSLKEAQFTCPAHLYRVKAEVD